MEIHYQLTASDLEAVRLHWQGQNGQGPVQPEGSYALALMPAGISSHAPDGRAGFYAWPEITALEITDRYLYFCCGREVAFAVPCAALEGDAARVFAEEARRLWAAHPGHVGRTLPAVAGSRATGNWANLREAARLVFFREFDIHFFHVSYGALSWLLLAKLLWLGAMDYARALPMPALNYSGIGVLGASWLLLFAWAAAVSGLVAQRATLWRLLVMAVASLLVIDLVTAPIFVEAERLMPDAHGLLWGLHAAAVLWMLAAMSRIMRRLYAQTVSAALFLSGAYILFTLTLGALLPPGNTYLDAGTGAQVAHAAALDGGDSPVPDASASLGEDENEPAADGDASAEAQPDDEYEEPQPAAGLDVEDVFYRQPDLVRQALAGVAPRRPGETGLYFVGFAGDGSEREFGNEVRFARNLLDSRFNTAGRSLLLINRAETVNDTPLANTHNLEAVLQGLASRMDTQNDVLFLFLSSHGAQDHRLAVSFSPLEMHDLKAEKLKEMLDKSGIRNRVIVVSACYSGGFLDVLKDDNTLILTASRRDHVAYGCGDITEYTYFGEAYFVNALRHNDSFITAFDEARRLIDARERSEGEEASGPQIHVGRNIGKVLERLKVLPAGETFKAQQCPDDCPGESG